MAREFKPSKNYTFLRINSLGELYETSKEPKEGFTKQEGKEGNVYYTKSYQSTDYGRITYLGIEEKTFPTGKVKYLQLSILSEDEQSVDVIQLPLIKQSGGLSDEVKKAIAILPSLDYSKTFVISSNRDKNERGYIDRLLYFRAKAEEGEEKDTPIKFSLKFGEKGNVPMFTVEEDPLATSGKTYSYKEQDNFLKTVLLYELKRFTDFKAGDIYESEYFKVWETEETPSETPAPAKKAAIAKAKAEAPVEVAVEENVFDNVEEDDDSPF